MNAMGMEAALRQTKAYLEQPLIQRISQRIPEDSLPFIADKGLARGWFPNFSQNSPQPWST
jgi:hypothetical protein